MEGAWWEGSRTNAIQNVNTTLNNYQMFFE